MFWDVNKTWVMTQFQLLNNLPFLGYKIITVDKTMCPILPSVMGFHKMPYIWRVQILGSKFLSSDFSIFWDLTWPNIYKTGRYCCFKYIYAKKCIWPKLSHTSFCHGWADYDSNGTNPVQWSETSSSCYMAVPLMLLKGKKNIYNLYCFKPFLIILFLHYFW